MPTKHKAGFTLIELLVVIAIIGIIVTIVTLAMQSARAKARDSKRVSDIKTIHTALEQYHIDEGSYPLPDDGGSVDAGEFAVGSPLVGPTSGITYMHKVPSNPTPTSDGSCSGSEYSYSSSDGSTYTLSYCLGSSQGRASAGNNAATPLSVVDESAVACGGGSQECGYDATTGEVCGTCSGGQACNSSNECVAWACGHALEYEGGPCGMKGEDCDGSPGGFYRTVAIDGKCWFRDNLNVGTKIATNTDQQNDSLVEKYCHPSDDSNCSTYGGYYHWAEAMGLTYYYNSHDATPQYSHPVQGICPSGWHIPHDELDWHATEDYLKNVGASCDPNRQPGEAGWDCLGAGTKMKDGGSSNLDLLLAGFRRSGDPDFWWDEQSWDYAQFWTQKQEEEFVNIAYVRAFNTDTTSSHDEKVYRTENGKTNGLSVRCVKDGT